MRPTGRTEGRFVKLRPDIKREIVEKAKNDSFNFGKWIEEKWLEENGLSVDKLREERRKCLKRVELLDKKILEREIKMEEYKRFDLSNQELKQLIICCDSAKSLESQRETFCASVEKRFNINEFKKLKRKYGELCS